MDGTPGIGHNNPPLGEVLADETASLRARADDLRGQSERAVVTDEDTAGRAIALAGLMRDHLKEIEEARKVRKEPFLEGGRTVDRAFNGIAETLATMDARGKVVGGPLARVLSLVDAYRTEQERLAAVERRRLEEETRRQREAAEAAERARREAEEREKQARLDAERRIREAEVAEQRATSAREAAEAQRQREAAEAERERQEAAAREAKLQAELDQRRAEDEVTRLERQQVQTAPSRSIDSGYGYKESRRAEKVVEITDWNAALRHAWKIAPDEIKAVVKAIYVRQAKAKVTNLPGAAITEISKTVIRGAA